MDPECPEATIRESLCGPLGRSDAETCAPYGDAVSSTDFTYLVSSAPENNTELSPTERARFRDFTLDVVATRDYQANLFENRDEPLTAAEIRVRCCYQKCSPIEVSEPDP